MNYKWNKDISILKCVSRKCKVIQIMVKESKHVIMCYCIHLLRPAFTAVKGIGIG